MLLSIFKHRHLDHASWPALLPWVWSVAVHLQAQTSRSCIMPALLPWVWNVAVYLQAQSSRSCIMACFLLPWVWSIAVYLQAQSSRSCIAVLPPDLGKMADQNHWFMITLIYAVNISLWWSEFVCDIKMKHKWNKNVIILWLVSSQARLFPHLQLLISL